MPEGIHGQLRAVQFSVGSPTLSSVDGTKWMLKKHPIHLINIKTGSSEGHCCKNLGYISEGKRQMPCPCRVYDLVGLGEWVAKGLAGIRSNEMGQHIHLVVLQLTCAWALVSRYWRNRQVAGGVSPVGGPQTTLGETAWETCKLAWRPGGKHSRSSSMIGAWLHGQVKKKKKAT